MIVWVLVFFVGSSYGPQPAVIDNIADGKTCAAIRAQILGDIKNGSGLGGISYGAKCYPVRKAKP